jgi:hypothetical protein
MRWPGHVARKTEKSHAYRILVGKPEAKRPLGRPICRWVNNIKIDLREMGWIGLIWLRIGTSGGALVNTVMNLLVTYNSGKFLSSCTIGGFSRRAQLHE